MKAGDEFFNLYNHDFVRVAVALPAVKVADPTFNGFQTVEMISAAAQRKAVLVLFPELGLSAYSCEDLFHQRALLEGCRAELARIVKARNRCRRVQPWSARRSKSITCCSIAPW